MMTLERLGDMLDIYKHSLGSIDYCARKMRVALEKDGNQEAVDQADVILKKCLAARKVRYDYNQKKVANPLRRKGARQLDAKIDTSISALRKAVDPYTKIEADVPVKKAAEELIEGVFPEGVFPITSMSYEDQYIEVDELVARLRGPFADQVGTLHLEALVDQVDGHNKAFGTRLGGDEEGVTHDAVEAAFIEAEDAFHELIFMVVFVYRKEMAKLNEVLESLFIQEERLRRYHQRRGGIPEVDPETGEPIDEDVEPAEDDGDDEPNVDADQPDADGEGEGEGVVDPTPEPV